MDKSGHYDPSVVKQVSDLLGRRLFPPEFYPPNYTGFDCISPWCWCDLAKWRREQGLCDVKEDAKS